MEPIESATLEPSMRPEKPTVRDEGADLRDLYDGDFRRFTVEEYQAMVEAGILAEDEKIELLDGVIVAVSPQGLSHATLIERLTRALILGLPDHRVRPQLPMIAGKFSMPEPDFLVVAGTPSRRKEHPRLADLIIEIAHNSLRKDRNVKLGIYARAGVPEYWIVNVRAECIEVYRDPDVEAGTYRKTATVKPGAKLKPAELPGPTIDVAELFAED
jgi:Uma2 family endonuclease